MGSVVWLLAVATAGQAPPLCLPPADAVALPNGVAVSQPLTAVAPYSGPFTARSSPDTTERGVNTPLYEIDPLGRTWQRYEYLLWWSKPSDLPPLVTASRGPAAPALGGPTTVLLVGGGESDATRAGGGRFTAGASADPAHTLGLEVTYLFLGTRTDSQTVSGGLPDRPYLVGRPVIDPATRDEDVVPVAVPGRFAGAVRATTSSRLTGWEVNGVANLLATEAVRVNAVAGYRYLQETEGLRVEQWAHVGGFPDGLTRFVGSADQFDAHTRFHGGQLGLTTDLTRGPVFLEAAGKVAVGQAVLVVRNSGRTIGVTPAAPTPTVLAYPAAALVRGTNAGRFVDTAFAVLPEASLKLGYRFRDRARFHLGYNFVYLSEAVRAAEQSDPVVDANAAPLFGAFAAGSAAPTVRPLPAMAHSDFWAQGVLFGMEYRY